MKFLPSPSRPAWPIVLIDILATITTLAAWVVGLKVFMDFPAGALHDLLFFAWFFSIFLFYWMFRHNKTVIDTIGYCYISLLPIGLVVRYFVGPGTPQSGTRTPHILESVMMIVIIAAVQAFVTAIVQIALARPSDFRNTADR